MPNTASAERRVRSSEQKHLRNRSLKARLKTLEKGYLATLPGGKADVSQTAYRKVSSALDKAAKGGVIRKETASRKRSRLQLRMNALAAAAAKAPATAAK